MNNKSKLGYSKNSPYKDEPAINIESNQITMKNTDQDLLGIGIKNGNIVKVISMKAGESKNYDFGDVDSVLEIPKYALGGMSGTNPPNGGYDYFNDPNQIMNGQQQGTEQAAYLGSVANTGSRPQVQNVNTLQYDNKIVPGETPQEQLQKFATEATKLRDQGSNSGMDSYQNQNPQYDQFFNPYGGVDLETAWAGFGRGLASKDNKGLTALYGLKAGLGTARNMMGGYATEKRNQYVDQHYQDQMQESKNGRYVYGENGGQFFQDGGALTREDIASIKNSTQDIGFTDDTIQNLFERVPETPAGAPKTQAEPNLGRYKDVGYFDIVKNAEDAVVITNTKKNPHNPDTVGQVVREIRGLNPDRKVEFKFTPQYKDGGRASLAEKLTGEYTEGLANKNEDQAVAEVETKEYLQSPDGEVTQVKGQTHEQGGEKMTAKQMEDGTKVISDNLKIGGDNAKYFKDKYEIKAKAKDTYATIIDRVSKKIGLKDLVEEQEEVIKKLEKNQKGEDENTQKLNLEFLSKKLKDIETKKAPLEEARKLMVDDIYEKQEASKPREEQDQTVMEDGGEFDSVMIEQLAKKHNISLDAAMGLIKEYKNGGEVKKYADGGASKKRLQEFYNQARSLGYEGEINLDAEDLGAEAGKLQQWMVQNRPEEVVKYFSNGIPITAKGVELIKQNNPEVFEKAGVSRDKDPAAYTDEEKLLLQNTMKEAGTLTDDFILNQFNDNKWHYRAPVVGMTQPNKPEQIGREIQGEMMTQNDIRQPSTPEATTQRGGEESSTNSGGMSGLPLLPDQSVPMPNAQMAHGLFTINSKLKEGQYISPEQALSNLGSQMSTATSSVNQRPDSQRTAALAQLMAGYGQNSNNIVGQTDQLNQQERVRVNNENTDILNRDQLINSGKLREYEQLQFRAKEITDQDYRDWFDFSRKVQLNNHNQINQMNLLNQLFDNYEIGSDGTTVRQKSSAQFFPTQPTNLKK